MQHGINGCRKESQIPEPAHATIRKKPADLLHLTRREAVSFANLKTFVPGLSFADSFFGHGFFRSGQSQSQRVGRAIFPLPRYFSHINLFGYCQRIVNLNAKIPDGALNFAMAE